MSANQTVKERLISFISYLDMGQGKFEKLCGLSNGYVNNIRKSITIDKMQLIASHFPELNTNWLITGEGDMLNKQGIIANHGIAINGNVSGNNTIDNRHYDSDSPDVLKKQIEDLERTIAERERLLEEKEVRIKEKDTQIKEKDTQIKTLLDIIACKQGQ